MNQKEKEVYQKIEATYNSEKGKGFITHLLRSFFPVNKSHEVLVTPTKNDKEIEMKCCITGVSLFCKNEHLKIMLDNHKEMFKETTQQIINQSENKPVERPAFNKVKDLIDQKPLAIACKSSDKFLSVIAFQQLHNFFATEIMKENKHIKWIMNNERAKAYKKQMEKDGYSKKERKVVQKAVESGSAKMSLGDLDVLQQLKNKMTTKQ